MRENYLIFLGGLEDFFYQKQSLFADKLVIQDFFHHIQSIINSYTTMGEGIWLPVAPLCVKITRRYI